MRRCFILVFLFFFGLRSASQGADWKKDVPGKLFPVATNKIPGFRINSVFDVINEVPVIAKPKGYNVKEWVETITNGKVYTARLYINFYPYYSHDKGPVKLQSSHPHTISFFINDPAPLMNPQSILFLKETQELNMPVMFTDTFQRSKIVMNDTSVLYAINMNFNSRLPLYILMPEKLSFFRPVTTEQYIRFWIGKLSMDIIEAGRQLKESRENLSEIENNPALHASITEMKKAQEAFVKWTNFLKEKKQYYQKKITEMSDEEKKSPAAYAMHTEDLAVMMDRNGKYVETISGHLPYEPAEGKGSFARFPLYTFIRDPFDAHLPKTAIQLLIIEDAFSENRIDEFKDFLYKDFYPALNLKKLHALLNK